MSGIPAGAGQLLGKRLGKFEILALLALGGTAEIYLARIGGAAGFEKYVVVKCLHDHLADDAEFVRMFLDEARLAAHLDHSNIVQTMELGQHEGRYYMVMEFLAGLSLAMIVRRANERLPNTRIPVPLVLNILAQSSAGLHYAHEKSMNGKPLNIVHRDISPQNLVISFEGVVKIVDFGIAKAEMRETRTRSGTIKGKFAYMSPEQCVANNVDRRTDVFALGVIGHELLTGRRLFKRPSPYETYQAVIECDVKPPSMLEAGVDPALDPVILRALTKDKAERYPTAEAFGDALLGYLHHRGIGSGPGDVSRFFDAHFGQELEEHSGRMRELISGRDIAVDTGISWGGEDAEDYPKRGNPDDRSLVRESGEIEELHRPHPGPPSSVLDDLGVGSRVEDDDEMPAERTRIETNPLERVNELDRLVASTPAPKPSGSGRFPPSAAPPEPPLEPLSSVVMTGMPPSGRFPDLANLPTVIAPESNAAIGVPPAAVGFANAPTALAPPSVPPVATGFANAPASLAASGFANAPTHLEVPPFPDLAKTQIAPLPMGLSSDSSPGFQAMPPGYPAHAEANGAPGAQPRPPQPSPPRPQVSSSEPPIQQASIPTGYPVMNAELSAQIATGATVFPSDARSPPQLPVAPLGSHPGPRSAEPSGPRDGYVQAAALPRVSDSGPGHVVSHDGTFSDPQRAAALMSPVGQNYPENVDWAAAAATRARAVPPWLLAILFIGALGIALALTIAIARLVS